MTMVRRTGTCLDPSLRDAAKPETTHQDGGAVVDVGDLHKFEWWGSLGWGVWC